MAPSVEHRPHARTKPQEIRFAPFYQTTHSREGWVCGPKFRRFRTEIAARAYLSALQRRKSKGGRVVAKLEHRDRSGIWHVLPLEGGCQS